MTTQLNWHYAFFINLPICGVLAALLLLGMPHERPARRCCGRRTGRASPASPSAWAA